MKNNKNLNLPLVSFLFLLASIFRIFFLNLIEFKADQAISFFQTFEFFQNPQLTQVGLISSIGTYNFPLFNYILVLLSLFYKNPQFLSFLIAFVNCILLIFFYFFVKKYYGFKTSIITFLIIAFSPWAILFSRSIWAQDLILLFVLPTIILIHQIILKNKEKYIFPLFILLTLFSQLHSSGLFFFLATLLILFIYKVKVKIKKALQGIGVGLIFAIPYFIFELSSQPFCRDCHSFLLYLQTYPKSFDPSNFLRPFQILNGSFFQYELGKDFQAFIKFFPALNFLNILFFAEFLITISGIIFIIKYAKNYKFLVIYFFAIPLLFFLTKTASYPHYYVSLIPVSALISAVFLNFLINKNKIAGFLLIFVFIASNIYFETNLYAYLNAKQNINGDYGPIYSLTDTFINKQTESYILLPYYEELKNYALIFSNSSLLHQNLGNYLLNKGNYEAAKTEFEKQLITTPNSSFSLANLAYVFILEKDYTNANKIINKLEKMDKITANRLKELMK